MSNLVLIFLIAIFKIIFLIDLFFFYNFIPQYLIYLIFMSNLILILLIFFALFFLLILFSILSLNICLIMNLAFLFFFCLLLIGSPRSHDLGHRFEKLAQVDFDFFVKNFFSNRFFAGIFFALLFMGSSQFHFLGHVFDLLTRIGCQVHSRLFYVFFHIFPSYQHVSIPYILLMYSALCNIFYGVVYSISFIYISRLSHGFFRVDLSFIYLNK
jgi:hypothetical protein